MVEPLRGVHYRVVRELELICRFGGRVRSGSGASTAGTTFGPQVRTSTWHQGVNVSKRAISIWLGKIFRSVLLYEVGSFWAYNVAGITAKY